MYKNTRRTQGYRLYVRTRGRHKDIYINKNRRRAQGCRLYIRTRGVHKDIRYIQKHEDDARI